jgi:hypothetical protein
MMPATADLLDRVRAAGAQLEVRGNRLLVSAAAPIPNEMLEALCKCKTEVLTALQDSHSAATFRERVERARDCQDLYCILGDADMAFVHGYITGDDVDDLCLLARRASQSLPEETSSD